jgi:RimJ/RimL family protein N-acetyltransferase
VLRPTLIENGIALVPLTAKDAVELAPLLDDSRLHEFTGGEPASLPALTARYRRLEAGAPTRGGEEWMNWVIRRREDDQAIGTAQATVRDRTVVVAWVVARPWQGSGYGRAAARALVAWAYGRNGLTVIAHIHPAHVASERVARSAGLIPTCDWIDGERVWRVG